jgi:hypothetical protein
VDTTKRRYPDEQIGDTKWAEGGGTATIARTDTPATFQDARRYAEQARAILTEKGATAGFDIGTTAVGALLLGFEALLSALPQEGTAWPGHPPPEGAT